jgi:hypothetical protein
MTTRALLAAAALLACLPATSAEARCKRAGYRFGPAVAETSTTWRVKAGTACTATLRPGRVFLHGLSIVQGARHGVAGSGSRYQYAYKPAPDFTGRDQFILRIDHDFRGARGSTTVRVNVDVVPRL